MEPSDWILVAVMLIATVSVCVFAPALRSRAEWLPGAIQFLSGFIVPPILVWAAFAYWGSIRGTHNSGGLLFLAWFSCMVIGILFSRRRANNGNDQQA